MCTNNDLLLHCFDWMYSLSILFQILPGLYVGNLRDSKDSRQLDIHRITHILSIHDDDARKPFKVKDKIALVSRPTLHPYPLNHLLSMLSPPGFGR